MGVITHGMSGTTTYNSWDSMKSRCLNPNYTDYKHYGGRGITICDSWLDFRNFLKDMGIRPTNKTIDRINNDGNYNPGNCKWSTASEQRRNQRINNYVIINDDKKLLCEWLEIYNIKYCTFYSRMKKGWSSEEALTTPVLIIERKILWKDKIEDLSKLCKDNNINYSTVIRRLDRGWTLGRSLNEPPRERCR